MNAGKPLESLLGKRKAAPLSSVQVQGALKRRSQGAALAAEQINGRGETQQSVTTPP